MSSHYMPSPGGADQPVVMRTCLKCGEKFESIGKGNRVCPGCATKNGTKSVRTMHGNGSSRRRGGERRAS